MESPKVTSDRGVRGSRHVDAGQPVIRLRDHGLGNLRLRGHVAFLGDVGVVQRRRVRGGRAGLAGEVEADGEIRDRRHVEIHRIAEQHHARSEGASRFAVEGQAAIRIGNDGRLFPADGEMRRSDHHRRAAERVRQADAQALSADAGAHDHADRLIVEPARADRLRRGGRAGGRRRRRCRGAVTGLGGAGRTSACAVAQVATQRSWPLGWACIRPRLPSWANTRTGIHRCVTVHFLLRRNYTCYQTVGFQVAARRPSTRRTASSHPATAPLRVSRIPKP